MIEPLMMEKVHNKSYLGDACISGIHFWLKRIADVDKS